MTWMRMRMIALAALLAVGCGTRPDPHPVVEAPPVPGKPPVDPADRETFEEAEEVDASVLALVTRAARVEIASIDPSADGDAPAGDALGGYPVIARAAVPKEKREALADLLEDLAKPDGPVAKCFDPHHAVHVEEGARVIDVVICFECMQLQIVEGKRTKRVTIDAAKRGDADALFASLGVKASAPTH